MAPRKHQTPKANNSRPAATPRMRQQLRPPRSQQMPHSRPNHDKPPPYPRRQPTVHPHRGVIHDTTAKNATAHSSAARANKSGGESLKNPKAQPQGRDQPTPKPRQLTPNNHATPQSSAQDPPFPRPRGNDKTPGTSAQSASGPWSAARARYEGNSGSRKQQRQHKELTPPHLSQPHRRRRRGNPACVSTQDVHATEAHPSAPARPSLAFPTTHATAHANTRAATGSVS